MGELWDYSIVYLVIQNQILILTESSKTVEIKTPAVMITELTEAMIEPFLKKKATRKEKNKSYFLNMVGAAVIAVVNGISPDLGVTP